MTDDETGDPTLRRVLLPVHRDVSLWVSVFAFLLATLAFTALGVRWFFEMLALGGVGSWDLYALALAAVVGAGVNGYLNDDLLVSAFLALAPLVGFVLFLATGGVAAGPDPLSSTGVRTLLVGLLTAGLGVTAGGVGVWAGRVRGGPGSALG